MTQMNLPVKKTRPRYREQTVVPKWVETAGRKCWEFAISKCKLFYTE